MMEIPELLAHAMMVDRKCKKMARTLGAKAQEVAQEARGHAGEKRRVKEVLANHLHEKAGQMRFAPPMLDENE